MISNDPNSDPAPDRKAARRFGFVVLALVALAVIIFVGMNLSHYRSLRDEGPMPGVENGSRALSGDPKPQRGGGE